MKVNMALSGGMDSAAVLAHFLSDGFQVECFGFQYGSKHNPYENPCAEAVARWYGVTYTLLDLRPIMAGFRSNLMVDGGAIPEGHYEAPTMNLTVVPGRNIIFLSILAGIAWSRGASLIGIGIHQGDHAIYPDCRTSFFQAMDLAIQKGTDGRVRLIAPFLSTDKAGIVKWGIEHQVPFHLTRTCYKAQPLACGKCGSCRERIEAFEKNGLKDPVEYE
jgi:7-cyano-7-deazaguanine synthase